MSVATDLHDNDDHRCDSCGCLFRILSANANILFCPQCGQELRDMPATTGRKVGTGKRVSPKELAKQRRMDSIGAKLKELVDREDKANPLTDDQLAESIKESGIKVARRTVTKIRKRLGIPSARWRRDCSGE